MTLMQTEAIKVCVRVRPLSPKELENNERVCVRIPPESPHPATVMMLNPVDLSHSKNYSFDRAYWSVKPSDSHFATQESIMDDLGAELVAHVMDGYNACLFAYGQTGSGKTYTILGHETPSEQAGLLPRITEDIFTRIQDDRNSTNEFVVTISYLEIYNEQIRDLLVSPEEPRYKLEVRAHPKFGNFVFGVKEVPVMDWQNTKAWLDFGVKSRAVASTSMNATSSRSHCIFSMEIVHKIWSGGNRTQLRSKAGIKKRPAISMPNANCDKWVFCMGVNVPHGLSNRQLGEPGSWAHRFRVPNTLASPFSRFEAESQVCSIPMSSGQPKSSCRSWSRRLDTTSKAHWQAKPGTSSW